MRGPATIPGLPASTGAARLRVAAALAVVWLAGLLLLAAPLTGQASGSLRCGSHLVSEAMSTAEVRAICGTPDFRDVWSPTDGGPAYAPVEEWTYNFGSSRLLQLLRFSHGRLEQIDSEGYGFAVPMSGICGQTDIRLGMSKYRLLQRCGEPVEKHAGYLFYSRRHWERKRDRDLRNRYDSAVPVFQEEWTYNFGSNRLMRVVTLENGRVTDVQTTRRGFDP